jgi:hypothetical protein
MALHGGFPSSPLEILTHDVRWLPAAGEALAITRELVARLGAKLDRRVVPGAHAELATHG